MRPSAARRFCYPVDIYIVTVAVVILRMWVCVCACVVKNRKVGIEIGQGTDDTSGKGWVNVLLMEKWH